jgi:hypothetical protein
MERYEEYYGYPFLDELHNFFPDFLYNNQRFTSVPDVFRYLNMQMSQRFNLYTAAWSRHQTPQRPAPEQQRRAAAVPYFEDVNYINNMNNMNNNLNNNINADQYTPNNMFATTQAAASRGPAAAPFQRVAPGVSVVPEARTARRAAMPAVDLFSTEFVIRDGGLTTGGIAGLAGLASLLMPDTQRNLSDLFAQIPGFADPVIVRPSNNEIAASTTVQTQGVSNGEVCAICQDEIITNCQTRKINYCDHKFHKGCIDTWFAQNVHCPVCRHDIRTPAQAQDRQVDDETDDGEDENENIVD